jgi:hypothetical protein
MKKLKDILKYLKTEDDVLLEIKQLFESPLRIRGWTDVNLTDSFRNVKFTEKILDVAKKVTDYDDHEVYRYEVSRFVCDCFIHEKYTFMFFMYKTDGKTMLMEKVWQYQTRFGFARNAIFDLYLKDYERIVSDGIHSKSGEKYWEKLIKEAESKGFGVFVYDFSKKLQSPYDPSKKEIYYSSPNYRLVIQKD